MTVAFRALAIGLAAAVALAAPAFAGGTVVSAAPAIAAAPDVLKVAVGGVGADGQLDGQYSGYGRNISPPLGWSGAPPRTRAYAVVVEDPDGPGPQPTVHWIAWNIPASVHDLEQSTNLESICVVTTTCCSHKFSVSCTSGQKCSR